VNKATVRMLLALVVLLGAAAVPAPTMAQHVEGEEHEATETHEEHGGHELHQNHVALFLGSTEGEEHHGEKGDRDFTIGIDYERRLSKLFGIGAMVDWVAEGNREYLIGVPVFLHVGNGGKFQLAPAYHRVREGDEDGFVFRTAFAWDFYIKKISLAPYIAYDFTDGQDFTVFGLDIGTGW
jgi:hypothetical protein